MKNIIQNLILAMAIVIGQQTESLIAAGDASEIINKVKARFDKLETFSAQFSQTSYWKLANQTHQQQGTLWLKGKEKFKIETEDQTVVSDGKVIWSYSKFNNQVIVDQVSKTEHEMNLPKDIFLVYSEQYVPQYLQTEQIDDQECYLIELQAKSEEVFIQSVKLWINIKNLIPIKIEQLDLNTNTNTYVLKNIVIDKPLADHFFQYQIPESVEVIDLRSRE